MGGDCGIVDPTSTGREGLGEPRIIRGLATGLPPFLDTDACVPHTRDKDAGRQGVL
jgi:hypothetical protein